MPEVYVARKKLKVGDDFVMPGDQVPQAVTWRNLHSYIASGAVRLVQTDVVQNMPMQQEIPVDAPFDWKERPVTRRRKGALKGWVDYGQTGEEPTPDPSYDKPSLTLTIPDTSVTQGQQGDVETSLVNATDKTGDGYTGKWTITIPSGCPLKAVDFTVNMVGFNGPGQDVLIDFTDEDDTVVGTYGPFPIAANMQGATTDQIVLDGDTWSGDLSVLSETLDDAGEIAAEADWTLSVTGQAAPAHTVTGIDPSDTIALGETLTVTGTGFTDAQGVVLIGNTAANLDTFEVVDDNTVTAQIHQYVALDVYTSVSVNGGGGTGDAWNPQLTINLTVTDSTTQ